MRTAPTLASVGENPNAFWKIRRRSWPVTRLTTETIEYLRPLVLTAPSAAALADGAASAACEVSVVTPAKIVAARARATVTAGGPRRPPGGPGRMVRWDNRRSTT